LQLFYSVNGGAEKTVNLFGGAKPLTEVSAGHTIYLEELGLKPATSCPTSPGPPTTIPSGAKTATSDIYFVQIRPFRKDYKPAQSAGGGGGGGGNEVGALSQQQREIVAATFNVVRDRPKMAADKFRENVVFLTLAQAKLREQVEELVGNLNSRLRDADPALKNIAEALPKAATEMKAAGRESEALQRQGSVVARAAALKPARKPSEAMKLVAANRNGGGGGGGLAVDGRRPGGSFELELDKLR
jgi:hypothetical protein